MVLFSSAPLQTTYRGVASDPVDRGYDAALALDAIRALRRDDETLALRRAGKDRRRASAAEANTKLARGLSAAVPAIYSPDSTMRKKAALKILRDFKNALGGADYP